MPHVPASSALSRFVVLDLTRVRSGPTCVRQLADFGADVIKIEPTPGSDPSTEIFGSRHDYEMQNLHRNKRSMTLNLKEPRGREIFMKLVAQADVVVENYRPDVKARLGIDYESLKKVNRRIVLASLSGFGQDGPYVERGGFDQIAQGMTGIMSVTGFPEQGPTRVGGAICDVMMGYQCAFGIAAALLEREISGEGQWVQTDLLNAGTSLIDFQVARFLFKGDVAKQGGNDHPSTMPVSSYRTKDGYINIAASGNAIWKRLCEALGKEEWLALPEYASDPLRVKNRKPLNEALNAVLATRTSAQWIDVLNEAGVPCGPIYNLDQVFDDPQVKHLGIAASVKHPVLGEIRMQNQPVTLSRTPGRVAVPTPELGEHTGEILASIGYASEDIGKLRSDKVV
ncbi:MAG: formyl-CoA transferase [Betaproteobacteria bacterium RIFCSPLOWO2_02_FULL_62_17]|nr:MAG: formyl-CoA transferase [Betaproteobacteria bacterium RIFCSPLOWO2_02_FULL_62_17]